MDLHGRFQWIVGVLKPDVRLATFEETEEGVAEVLANLIEGALEEIGGCSVDLPDGGPQVVACLHQVVPLLRQESQPLALFFMLLHREHTLELLL